MPESLGWGSTRNTCRFDPALRSGSIIIEIETGSMLDPYKSLAMHRAMKAADRTIGDVCYLSAEEAEKAWQTIVESRKGQHVKITPMET